MENISKNPAIWSQGMNLIYHMTRTAPRAIALENHKKKGSVSEGRTHRSHSFGETRTALLEMRTALLEMRAALLEMHTALLEMHAQGALTSV